MERAAAKRASICSRWCLRDSAAALALILPLLGTMGCGGSKANVSGTVTLDGKPVEGSSEIYGTVTFYREGGGGAPAIGIIKEAGHYDMSTGATVGLEPGEYIVGVAVKKILPPATPDGLTRPQRLTPVKYARPEESGFHASVQPGRNTFDFALESRPNG